MSPLAIPVVGLAAVTAYVGVHHLLLGLRRRQGSTDLLFAAACLAMVTYDVLCIGLYDSRTGAEAHAWQRGQIAALAVVGTFLLWLVRERVGWPSRKASAALTGPLLLLGALQAIDPWGLGWSVRVAERQVSLPFGLGATFPSRELGPLVALLAVLGVGTMALLLGAAWRHRRAGHRSEGTSLVLAISAYLVAIGNDVAVDLGLAPGPYLLEYAYVAFIGIMATSLAREVLEGQRAAEALAETRGLLEAVMEHSDAAIFVKDREARYLRGNRSFGAFVGRPEGEIVGRTDYDLFGKEEARIFRGSDRRVLQSAKPVQVVERTGAGEGARTWLVAKFPLLGADGAPVAVAGIATDVTERARAQEALAADHAALERRVEERTAEVARARDELLEANRRLLREKQRAEEASQAKSRFLAAMSHEIRTPLNGVLGMLDLALEDAGDAAGRSRLEVAHRSGRALLRIIDDVLDFSRLEADKVTLELAPFRLDALLDDLAAMYGLLARAKGLAFALRIAPEVPCGVLGDAGRLRQVLVNLVTNALKFTELGGITVALDQVALGGIPRYRFTVEDTGIGVPPGQLERIFQEFDQADPGVGRRYGGTGLGLAISRRLADRMGGSLEAESEPGPGARFVLTLPLPVTDAASASRQGPPADGPSAAPSAVAALEEPPRRVLLVEDNSVNRLVARTMLERLHCEVDVAHDGREAVERVRRGGYDLVLMDWEMPVMNGLEATAAIRSEEAAAGGAVPIVGLTAHAGPELRAQCLEAGMNDCLVKPVDREKLRAALRSWTRAA